MRTTFVNKIKVDYDILFNQLELKIFIPKRVGQRVFATLDGKQIPAAWECDNSSMFHIFVDTTKYYYFGECVRDVIINRFSYKKVIDLASRRASYELLRALS